MSFSKIVSSYIHQLQSWVQRTQLADIQKDQASRKLISLPGAVFEIFFLSADQIFFTKNSGSLSDIEMALLESLAGYMKKFKNVPSLRELDFFLRDKPSQAAWPETFNMDFMKESLIFLTHVMAMNFTSPISWLNHQLMGNVKGHGNLKMQIEEPITDKIIVYGSKQDAWVIEKNFDEWQQNLRDLFQRPQLVLLFAIKS